MIVWADTVSAKSVKEVPIFKDYNKLTKKIGYYSDGWFKSLSDPLYESTKTIIDEWNKTHKRKITSVCMDDETKKFIHISIRGKVRTIPKKQQSPHLCVDTEKRFFLLRTYLIFYNYF